MLNVFEIQLAFRNFNFNYIKTPLVQRRAIFGERVYVQMSKLKKMDFQFFIQQANIKIYFANHDSRGK